MPSRVPERQDPSWLSRTLLRRFAAARCRHCVEYVLKSACRLPLSYKKNKANRAQAEEDPPASKQSSYLMRAIWTACSSGFSACACWALRFTRALVFSSVWPAPGHCKNKRTASPVRTDLKFEAGHPKTKRLMDASLHNEKRERT